MNESHPSRKRFGDIINLTFKVYFSDFWRNLGTGVLIFLASLLCFIPLVLVFLSAISFTGYPFYDFNPAIIVALVLGYILIIVGVSIFVPSFFTSFFGQKTLDTLQKNEVTPKERRKKMFSSVGRIAGVQTIYIVAYAILSIAISIPMFINMFSYSFMELAYGYGMDQFSNMMWMNNIYSIVLTLAALIFVFLKQEALFQNKRWFSAFGGGIRTLFKGNFWVTIGEFIVFGLMVMVATYIIFFISFLILGLIGAAIIIPFGLMGAGGSLTSAAIVAISVLGTIFVAVMVAFSSIYTGLVEVFSAIVYFNARTTSDGEAFPGFDENAALESGKEE